MNVNEFKNKYGQELIHSLFMPQPNIIETLCDINSIYIPNTIMWLVSRKSQMWEKIRDIERNINVAVLCDDSEELREQLDLYFQEWLKAISEFEPIKNKFIPF